MCFSVCLMTDISFIYVSYWHLKIKNLLVWNLRFLVTFLTSCRYQHVCMNEIALILVTGLAFDFLLAFNWYYCIFSFEFWGSLHRDCWRIVVRSFFSQTSIAMICFTYSFLKPISASSEIKRNTYNLGSERREGVGGDKSYDGDKSLVFY